MKRLLILCIAVAICCFAFCTSYAAKNSNQYGTIIDSGECYSATGVYYTLTSDGVLIISGSGSIGDSYSSIIGKSPLAYIGYFDKVIIEDGITGIGNKMFSGCIDLKSVKIPDSVVSIDAYAFSTTGIEEITLPDSVEKFGEGVFWGCEELKKIEFPDNIHTISKNMFLECKSIKKIEIPDSVTSIGEEAFSYCESLELIEIPDSVSTIGKRAFYNCFALTSIKLPNSLKEIQSGTFGNCHKLKSIEIPDSVTKIGESVFYECDSLETITIPNSVTEMGDSIFNRCDALTSIDLPDSITEIADGMFQHCMALESVSFSNSVKNIGRFTFVGCDNLKDIYYGGTKEEYSSIHADNTNDRFHSARIHCAGDEDIVNDLTYGEQDTYTIDSNGHLTISGVGPMKQYNPYDTLSFDNKDVKTAAIEGKLTTIAHNTFEYCENLTSVKIPDGIVKIGEWAFYECTSLTDAKLPQTLEVIEKRAFGLCSALPEIIIPDSVISIGEYAFLKCTRATSLKLSNSLKEIGHGAFQRCDSLPSVIIPDSVVTIGEYAFNQCYNLEKIEIPTSVKEIGEFAFYFCNSLKDVYYCGSEEEWKNIKIAEANESLTGATIHYNSKSSNNNATNEPKTNHDDIKVIANGVNVSFDQPPVIENGRTLVPVRAISETLGAVVSWDAENSAVGIVKGDLVITLVIGSTHMTAGEVIITLDVPGKIINGRTLVPLRAISEAFGCNVFWEENTRTITITN